MSSIFILLLFSICLGVRLWLTKYINPPTMLSLRSLIYREKANGRLGHSNFPNSTAGVPFPTQVRLPSVQVVSLVAGGMYVSFYLSFSAESHWSFKVIPCFGLRRQRPCLGCVLVMSPRAILLTSLAGTLDGSSGSFSQNSGFSLSSKQAKTPLKLKLPTPIRSIR